MTSKQEKQRRRELAKAAEQRQGPQFDTRVGIDSWIDVLTELDDRVMPSIQENADRYLRVPSLYPEANRLVANGSMLCPPASETTLASLERRLELKLPPSVRGFLAASDGLLLPRYCNFLSTEKIGPFPDSAPDVFAAIEEDVYPQVEDSEYFTYGSEQDCFCIRPHYLRNALALTDGGTKGFGWCVLVRDVRFPTGEHEIWDFAGWGTTRFRSFGEYFEFARCAIVESLSWLLPGARPSLP